MRTAIVTGANGFVGSWLVKELLSNNVKVIAVIRNPNENIESINLKGVEIVYCELDDITDLGNRVVLSEQESIDAFYHLAWAGVSTTLKNDYNVQMNNIKRTYEAIQAAYEMGCKKFVCTGSISEYAYNGSPVTGNECPTPADLYAACKASSHLLCDIFSRQHGISLNWVLISSIYGPGRLDNNLISYTIKSLLKKEVPQFTKLEQQWDYIFVSDLAKALYLIGEKGMSNKTYPIGSGERRPLYDFVEILRNEIDAVLPVAIGALPYKTAAIDNSIVDISELQRDTGFVPSVLFKEGVKKTIAWFKEEG